MSEEIPKQPEIRQFSGWFHFNVLFLHQNLRTALSVDKEYWFILRAATDIEEVGKELLNKHGVTLDLDAGWRLFSSYIKQAEHYWNGAVSTSPKSAGLLYYYSFMDLVKAFLLLRGRAMGTDKEIHGLKSSGNKWDDKLGNKFVYSDPPKTHGCMPIFQEYYKEIFSGTIPEQFQVWNLLSYSSDISHQYVTIGKGSVSHFRFIMRRVTDTQNFWTILAIDKDAELEKHSTAFTSFFSAFERCSTDQLNSRDLLRRAFDIAPLDPFKFTFYQSKVVTSGNKPDFKTLNDSLLITLNPFVSMNYHDDPITGYIDLPLEHSARPMNEEVAIYIVMFFVSELLRYHPDYMEKILQTKEGWVLETFIHSAPLTFLALITSRMQQLLTKITQF